MTSPETDLVEKLKTQDPESLLLLYDTYGRRIFDLAFRMTGNRQDAEDITHETLLAVFRHIKAFRGKSRLYTWIYAIVKNQCYRSYRQGKRTSFDAFERLLSEAANPELPDEMSDAEKQHLIQQVKEGCLTGLLRCLAFNQRIAFVLHTLLHLPVRDVAKVLGKSESATKVLVFHARHNLKSFLCKNCSLYDPANACRCENLIGFSLKQGWIDRKTSPVPDAGRIEQEIKQIRQVIALYASLDQTHPPEDMHQRIREWMRNQDYEILSRSKM